MKETLRTAGFLDKAAADEWLQRQLFERISLRAIKSLHVSAPSPTANPVASSPPSMSPPITSCTPKPGLVIRGASIVGDVLLAAAFVSYAGAFSKDYRQELWQNR